MGVAEAYYLPGIDLGDNNTTVNKQVSNHPDLPDTVSDFKTERPVSWKTLQSWRKWGSWSPKMSYKIAPLPQNTVMSGT